MNNALCTPATQNIDHSVNVMRRAQKYKAEPQTERYAAGLNASKQSHRTHTTEADIDEVAAMRFLSLNLDNKARK